LLAAIILLAATTFSEKVSLTSGFYGGIMRRNSISSVGNMTQKALIMTIIVVCASVVYAEQPEFIYSYSEEEYFPFHLGNGIEPPTSLHGRKEGSGIAKRGYGRKAGICRRSHSVTQQTHERQNAPAIKRKEAFFLYVSGRF
jgi:hypothetical protein